MSKKDQYVIACVESAESAARVLPWARHFAECLRHKGLMALHVKHTPGDAPEWLRKLGVPYASLTGDWHTAIEGLPTAFGAILAVAAVDPTAPRSSFTHPHTLLREFRNCKTAYLVVGEDMKAGDMSDGTTPLTAALTLTHHREGREKLVWASYLARFLNYRIAIAHPDYRDEGLRQRWQNNMHFADKLFVPLEISYTAPAVDSQTRVDRAALDQLHPDLLIARTTDLRDRDLVDLLRPLPERQLLAHPSHTPLLFLNPRDDLYILCD